ncbi:MAG TPA: hypothetical protein VK707_05235 [Solirubrobacteraceae bacterium]|jgi:hypothetical protein|nr:hypothetical protein [Solirubrobacteraceae bacterium]
MGVPPFDAPDLVGVITAANEVGLPYVVIGGFAVIANQYVRGTEDVDLLIEDDRSFDEALSRFFERIDARRSGEPLPRGAIATAETMRVDSRFGRVDLLRAGGPPVDFASVSAAAIQLTYHGEPARVASLASLVAFKRIADRPRDQLDLIELERIHGPLPIQPIPGLDD